MRPTISWAACSIWGIPAYRLPKEELDRETSIIDKMGIEVRFNTSVGKDVSFDEVRKGSDAVFMALGAHGGRGLGIENENAEVC